MRREGTLLSSSPLLSPSLTVSSIPRRHFLLFPSFPPSSFSLLLCAAMYSPSHSPSLVSLTQALPFPFPLTHCLPASPLPLSLWLTSLCLIFWRLPLFPTSTSPSLSYSACLSVPLSVEISTLCSLLPTHPIPLSLFKRRVGVWSGWVGVGGQVVTYKTFKHLCIFGLLWPSPLPSLLILLWEAWLPACLPADLPHVCL